MCTLREGRTGEISKKKAVFDSASHLCDRSLCNNQWRYSARTAAYCWTWFKHHPPQVGYLLTFKLSQDNIEVMFGTIRRRGGWNNNPPVQQFMYAFRGILSHKN